MKADVRDKIMSCITIDDLPEGFKFIGEHDLDLARKLITDMPGLPIYIPKANRTCLIKPYVIKRTKELYVEGRAYIEIIRILVAETETSDSTIRRLLTDLIREKVLPAEIYDKPANRNQIDLFS